MILRSLTRHVRDQNWFAVFLDFLIVVVGVFIGIQVSNWNEANIQRKGESAYLRLLDADVRSSQELAQSTLDMLQRQDDARRRLYLFSKDDDSADEPEAIPRLLNLSIWAMPTMEFNQTTFETLKSTGRLDVFGDELLIRELTDLQSDILDIRRREALETTTLVNLTDPMLIEHVDMAHMLMEPSISGRRSRIDWLPQPDSSFQSSDFLKSVQFRNMILARTIPSKNRIRALEGIDDRYQRILSLIDARQAKLTTR
jgi:hypothetical protein